MKVNNIRGIIYLVIILLFAKQAWASDWIFYATSTTGNLYYDKSSIKKVNKNIITVQTKKIYNENGKTKVFAFLKRMYQAPDNPDILNYDLMMQKIDCVKEKRSDYLLTIYDEEGNAVYSDDSTRKWKNVAPDSITNILKNTVCSDGKVSEPVPEAAQEHPYPAPTADAKSIKQKHFDRIRSAHPGFEKYWNNESIKAWIQKQPLHLRNSLLKTYKEGDTDSVIALITKFKKENIKIQPPDPIDQHYKSIKGIELMNGNVIEGQIISMNPETVKIRTKDGKILSYSFMKEIYKFIKE